MIMTFISVLNRSWTNACRPVHDILMKNILCFTVVKLCCCKMKYIWNWHWCFAINIKLIVIKNSRSTVLFFKCSKGTKEHCIICKSTCTLYECKNQTFFKSYCKQMQTKYKFIYMYNRKKIKLCIYKKKSTVTQQKFRILDIGLI